MSDKAFDFKKEYKDLYMPKGTPVLIDIPVINFIMADGTGDPDGTCFQEAVELLYGLSYTIKMSKMKNTQPEGYFEYVVPPLEGLWWIDDGDFLFGNRENWKWTIMIRQPEFVNGDVFRWACNEFIKKKQGQPVEKVRFEAFTEGVCVQMMHIGPYATEPETVEIMNAYMKTNCLLDRVGKGGNHHEIYLSDPRKGSPENIKTVLRHPVERIIRYSS